MVTKTVGCPKCKTHIEIQGNPGETKIITCPKCNTKGKFTFPGEMTKIETSSDSFCIEIENLTKRFKDLTAVDNISFKVRKGEIYGFLGPNGAGKSTTIKNILGLMHMNSGNIRINGYDINKQGVKARESVGYLPERVAFYPNLTPLQTMNFFCELWGVDKSVAKPLIKEVGLEDAINRKVGTFS
ncbi:MAG: ABC transporter ATP-binding protein, partial [Thermoplasmatales archaeon]